MPQGNWSITVDEGVESPTPAEGEAWTVGAVILNQRGEVFAQKRCRTRRLFPDIWDIVGGHVKSGETLLEALAREVHEETGWRLRRVQRLLSITRWTGDDDGRLRHEADYLVEVDGDLDHPTLEWSKHSTYGWFGLDDLSGLKENLPPRGFLLYDLIVQTLQHWPESL